MSDLIFLTLKKWLSYFKSPQVDINFFYNNAIIRSTYDYKLSNLVAEKKITKKDINNLYKICVLDKIKYLTNFYNNNLKINDKLEMNDVEFSLNNNKNPKFKNLVRNLYFKEILLDTSTIQSNIRGFLEVIIDLYKYNIIDYKLVTPSILKYISENKYSSMVSGLYFRASIMNPFLVYSISKSIFKNPKKILTPTLGWSSYLLGFIQDNRIKEYVGIDVISKVCNTTRNLAKWINPKLKVDIYCQPSEDLYYDKMFISKYKNYFDHVYFSPPYFQLELYKGEHQSTNRYKTYNEWLEKYWDITIKLCKKCLKTNGILCYIISGYKNNGKDIDLDTDMNNIILNNNFILIDNNLMQGTNIGFTKHRKYKETIYMFKKI